MYAQHPGSGFTIWMTGMQGAGKRTLAREVMQRLRRMGKPVEVLDSPEWAEFAPPGPGENPEERREIVRKAGFLARALTRAGGFVIVPFISPHREYRDALRREIGRFLEVFVDCDIETLMKRDRTGAYKKAMSGEIPNFIGITDPYEPPINPEVVYDSAKMTVDQGADLVIEALVREGGLVPGDAGMERKPRKPRAKKREAIPQTIRLADQEQAALASKARGKPAKAGKKGAAAAEAAPAPKRKPAAAKAGKAAAAPAKPARAAAKTAARPAAKAPARAAAKTAARSSAKAPAKAAAKAQARPSKRAPTAARKPERAAAKAPARTAAKARPAAKGSARVSSGGSTRVAAKTATGKKTASAPSRARAAASSPAARTAPKKSARTPTRSAAKKKAR